MCLLRSASQRARRLAKVSAALVVASSTSSRAGPLCGTHRSPLLPPAAPAEPGLDDARLLDFGRQHQSIGDVRRLGVELCQKRLQDLTIVSLLGPFQNEILTPDQLRGPE